MAFMRTAKHLDRAQSCTGHVSVSSIGCCLAKAAAWPGTLLQSHWLFIRCWGQAVPRPFKGLQLVLQCSSQCTAVTTCQPQPPEHGAVLSTPHAKLTQAYAMFHPALQVFEVKPLKAWSAVGITLASVAVSLYLISISPWYMLPLAWAFAGTRLHGGELPDDWLQPRGQAQAACLLGHLCFGSMLPLAWHDPCLPLMAAPSRGVRSASCRLAVADAPQMVPRRRPGSKPASCRHAFGKRCG